MVPPESKEWSVMEEGDCYQHLGDSSLHFRTTTSAVATHECTSLILLYVPSHCAWKSQFFLLGIKM
jgi:hypothetical protein